MRLRPLSVTLSLKLFLLLVLVPAVFGLLAGYWPRYPTLPALPAPWSVERIGTQALLADAAVERGYANINGPTVIEVPDWVQNPLGRYYLYFAHHKGRHIRLAYSDSPVGPWTVHEGGVLPLEQSGFTTSLDAVSDGHGGLTALVRTFELPVIRDYLILALRAKVSDPAERKARGISAAANRAPHVASPEVVIDHDARRMLLFYHGLDSRGGQSSRVAATVDGLNFRPLDLAIFSTYLRHFRHRDTHYLLGMPGVLYRSASLRGPYEPRGTILFEPDMRHAGLWLEADTLYVFWSRVGDAPERILLSQIELSDPDWDRWRATEPIDLLRPELDWEGAALPVQASLRGELDVAAHELRDPYVFRDSDGSLYLYYVGGGEKAIGVARLRPLTPARQQ